MARIIRLIVDEIDKQKGLFFMIHCLHERDRASCRQFEAIYTGTRIAAHVNINAHLTVAYLSSDTSDNKDHSE